MRPFVLALVFACSSPLVWGQELIDNNSFEQASSCPTSTTQIWLAIPWVQGNELGTPDYFNPCTTVPTVVGVPDNGAGTQAAFHGSSYAGFLAVLGAGGLPEWREYIQSPLLGDPLEAGKTYRFSMQLSLAEKSSAATDRIGAYFSPTAVIGTGYVALPYTPQVETPAGTFLTDITEWMSFSETFVAAGGEQHVTIGNFHDAGSSATTLAGLGPLPPFNVGTGYYYLDQVSLQCEPCADAPSDLTAWWPLDDTEEGIAYEVVAAQHGVHEDSPVPQPGYVDYALDFAGSGVSVPTSVGLEFDTTDFSIDAWVRPNALGTTQTLFAKIASVGSPTGGGYALALNADGTVTFTMVDAALGVATGSSTTALVAGEWSLVTVTVDRASSTGGKIYVGQVGDTFDPTTASGSLTNSLPLLFARDGGAGVGADLVGGLDEVEIFHRALTEGEVITLAQSRTSGKCKTYLELEPVIGIPVTVGGGGTIGTNPNITNGGGSTGTFTFAVSSEAAGTKCGAWTSTVAGPVNPIVRTPQPLRLSPGQTAPVQLELDVPRNLREGDVACYSVTTTHIETGRKFLSRAVLRGIPREPVPPHAPHRDRLHRDR